MPSFFARIADAAARFPDRPAIEVIRGSAVETTTYRALMDEAASVSARLAGAGIVAGDRVAILADNDARWIACYLGVLRLGSVAVPLDTAYKAPQVSTVIENSGARVLFTSARYEPTARAAADLAGAPAPRIEPLSQDATGSRTESSRAGAPPVADADSNAAAVMLYTSGTTADPKGVVLTHANLDAERHAVLHVVRAGETDVVLGVLPLFHALAQMANLLLPFSIGARVVFLETVNSTTLLDALQTRGVTIFACVPQFFYLIHQRVNAEVAKKGRVARTIFHALIGANVWLRERTGWNPGRRIFARVHHTLGASMRVLVTGGSRFDPAIARDLYGLGFTLLNAYGLTETSGAATVVRPDDRFTTSVGQPIEGVEIRIQREPADPAASDGDVADGEILIRGPIVMREYFNRPDATAETLKEGWLYTGDLGRLDADGRLYITGRKKEIIVLSSGKNLYPEEIEAQYRQSAVIKEICVLGLTQPGQPSAERLHAVVVPDTDALRERGIVNLRELVRFELEGRSVELPAYKRVLSFDVWLEPLPRTTTGKIKRHEVERRVRAQAVEQRRDDRPLSDAEREWLAPAARAATLEGIARRLDRPAVRPDANLELDLGLDSMERVELLTLLEHQHGTRVPADVRATIFTVRQLVEAVERAPAGGPSDTTGGSDLAWERLLAEQPNAALSANLARRKPIVVAICFLLLRAIRLAAHGLPGFRVTGTEHLPRQGPFIIAPNHATYLDGLIVTAALPYRTLAQVFLVGAAEQYQTPLRARLARLINIVPVDPDANLVEAMRAGAAGLRLKKVLLLFPEGERSIDGELKTFRKGAAILASHLDVPVVPVALDGVFALWPRGRPFNWRALFSRRRVTVTFGPPLRVSGSGSDYAGGTEKIRTAVRELLAGPRAKAQGPRAGEAAPT